MKLTHVEHRYHFEFAPDEPTVEASDGSGLYQLVTADVTVTPVDGGAAIIETRFRGYTLTITGRSIAPRPVTLAESEIERKLVERVRQIRAGS